MRMPTATHDSLGTRKAAGAVLTPALRRLFGAILALVLICAGFGADNSLENSSSIAMRGTAFRNLNGCPPNVSNYLAAARKEQKCQK